MSGVDLHWFLPINGDSRQRVGGGHGVGTGSAGLLRQASLDYLASVAQAAEQVGFTAARTPTGLWCEDAWLTTAMLVGRTERLKFLVAFRPGSSRRPSRRNRPRPSNGIRRDGCCSTS